MFFNYDLFRTVNHLLATSTGKIARRGLNLVMPLFRMTVCTMGTLVAGAWTERKKMYHGGSFFKLADDNMDIQNPEAQNRVFSGF